MKTTGYDLLCYFISHYKELTLAERKAGYDATFNILQKHFKMRHPYWQLKKRMESLFEEVTAKSVSLVKTGADNNKEDLFWDYNEIEEDLKAALSFIDKKIS